MSKRISKADRATLASLVEKYSADTVARLAFAKDSAKPASPKKRGVRAKPRYNDTSIWLNVQYRLASAPIGVEGTCRKLANDLKKWTSGPHLSWSRLKGMYWKADKRLADLNNTSLRARLAGAAQAISARAVQKNERWIFFEVLDSSTPISFQALSPNGTIIPLLIESDGTGPSVDKFGRGGAALPSV